MPEGDSAKNLKPLSEMLSFKGKSVLITGSAAGIGKATAYRFAEAGADLILVDINEEGLNKVKSELSNKFGTKIDIFKVDLSKKSEIDTLWDSLKEMPPDVLVNNAGIYPFKEFLEIDEPFLRKVIDINWTSVFWMCQHYIKLRKQQKKGGIIINVGTIEAFLPFEKNLVHYSLSKAGVLALTRSLAKRFGGEGFRVNAIVPGGIKTEGTKDVAKGLKKLNPELIKTGIEFKWRLPIGRFGEPDEIAKMILVLASDLASYVLGAFVPVDGGFLST